MSMLGLLGALMTRNATLGAVIAALPLMADLFLHDIYYQSRYAARFLSLLPSGNMILQTGGSTVLCCLAVVSRWHCAAGGGYDAKSAYWAIHDNHDNKIAEKDRYTWKF